MALRPRDTTMPYLGTTKPITNRDKKQTAPPGPSRLRPTVPVFVPAPCPSTTQPGPISFMGNETSRLKEDTIPPSSTHRGPGSGNKTSPPENTQYGVDSVFDRKPSGSEYNTTLPSLIVPRPDFGFDSMFDARIPSPPRSTNQLDSNFISLNKTSLRDRPNLSPDFGLEPNWSQVRIRTGTSPPPPKTSTQPDRSSVSNSNNNRTFLPPRPSRGRGSYMYPNNSQTRSNNWKTGFTPPSSSSPLFPPPPCPPTRTTAHDLNPSTLRGRGRRNLFGSGHQQAPVEPSHTQPPSVPRPTGMHPSNVRPVPHFSKGIVVRDLNGNPLFLGPAPRSNPSAAPVPVLPLSYTSQSTSRPQFQPPGYVPLSLSAYAPSFPSESDFMSPPFSDIPLGPPPFSVPQRPPGCFPAMPQRPPAFSVPQQPSTSSPETKANKKKEEEKKKKNPSSTPFFDYNDYPGLAPHLLDWYIPFFDPEGVLNPPLLPLPPLVEDENHPTATPIFTPSSYGDGYPIPTLSLSLPLGTWTGQGMPQSHFIKQQAYVAAAAAAAAPASASVSASASVPRQQPISTSTTGKEDGKKKKTSSSPVLFDLEEGYLELDPDQDPEPAPLRGPLREGYQTRSSMMFNSHLYGRHPTILGTARRRPTNFQSAAYGAPPFSTVSQPQSHTQESSSPIQFTGEGGTSLSSPCFTGSGKEEQKKEEQKENSLSLQNEQQQQNMEQKKTSTSSSSQNKKQTSPPSPSPSSSQNSSPLPPSPPPQKSTPTTSKPFSQENTKLQQCNAN
ncbi:hypothetical protein B0T20DRAFT_476397 [Sordaria brevicollis]|uniref:Uncharacterized protein n=1 Tax=Sordaria brevicollis TaxID=83679 RepID=A0AAE0UG92_SORBR|nr:hypothetical protein B0T20DRAFT_476397 [Sordaria brevicollis]